jgi:hypothetical protein
MVNKASISYKDRAQVAGVCVPQNVGACIEDAIEQGRKLTRRTFAQSTELILPQTAGESVSEANALSEA